MIEKVLSDLLQNPVSVLKEEELNSFLSIVKIVKEEDTHLCDYIRIIQYDNDIFIQEKNNRNEILIRKMKSIEEAESFVQERLDYYDRKWDGCGCKVDYYS